MSQRSQRSKSKQNYSNTNDTSNCKTQSDKRTSRFLATVDMNNEDSKMDNPEKAFFILLNICSELIQLHNDQNKLEVDDAIKQNLTFEQVAQLVNQKLQQFKRDYVTSEYQLIQLKESYIQNQQKQLSEQNSFEIYSKLHEQNQRWKQLYFQEARQAIEATKQQKQMALELEQQLEYISLLESKQEILEKKYLEMFEKIHSSNPNLDIHSYYIELQNTLDEKTEILQIQLQNSRSQCIELSKKLQDEILKVQASQELRIIDMQYVMSLENNLEQS